LPPGVQVFSIQGPLFFGAVENFERALAQTRSDPKALVIRLRYVPFMDITGLQVLEEVMQKLRRRGVIVLLCEANARVLGKLRRAGIVNDVGDDAYADQFPTALERAAMTIDTPRAA
jgi:SulP family sulfate permease